MLKLQEIKMLYSYLSFWQFTLSVAISITWRKQNKIEETDNNPCKPLLEELIPISSKANFKSPPYG